MEKSIEIKDGKTCDLSYLAANLKDLTRHRLKPPPQVISITPIPLKPIKR